VGKLAKVVLRLLDRARSSTPDPPVQNTYFVEQDCCRQDNEAQVACKIGSVEEKAGSACVEDRLPIAEQPDPLVLCPHSVLMMTTRTKT